MMLATSFPIYTLAYDNEANLEDDSLAAVDSKLIEETVLLKQIKKDMAEIFDTYLGSIIMSEEDVKAAVSTTDKDTLYEAFFAIDDVLVVAELSNDELYFIENCESIVTIRYLYEAFDEVLEFEDVALFAASGTHTPVTGVTVGVSSASDNRYVRLIRYCYRKRFWRSFRIRCIF